ncbi:ATP-dependent RNA helicase A-like isoform X1 [Sipha flava]|uniref:RNA helicase n=2 Tax=Sipha flava TaxID=143950 RepID=A0A8B8GQU8_9HEMI|nr:ATP-dependent RNA helicase A-like isoform X1 [Sipha flava]XP_025425469.1 ATP-dependent RNA helicase A-like isoform X1 [Sipha flava]
MMDGVRRLTSSMANLTTADTIVSAKTDNPATTLARWCSKKNLKPQFKFSVRQLDHMVICELMIPGYKYIGHGHSKTVKSAKKKATSDFLLFLVHQKELKLETSSILEKIKKNAKDSKINPLPEINESKNVDKNLVQSNWTIIEAKNRLKTYIKSHEKNCYTTNCTVNGKYYIVKMSIFIEELKKTITVYKTDVSQKSATEKCELSLVRKLYALGLIKHCLTSQKKNEKSIFNFFDVCVNNDLVNDVYCLLKDLNIRLMINKNTVIQKGETFLLNHVSTNVKAPRITSRLNEFSSNVLLWIPPTAKWNAWLGIQINNSKSLTQLSNKIERYTEKKKKSLILQKRIKDRADLPIFNKKHDILDIIKNNSVVIVHGGTGCGKTTQVCQFILDKYIHTKKGAYCNIICTQPRKVSAISIAQRVAYERAENLGKSVGYAVRFDNINPRKFGAILFCTTEILIRKLKNGLIGVSHVIVDEIHERRADSEFLLIILKNMVQKYPDLRVILMSANANLKVFSKYFNNCPIIDVKGRCYPVKEYFLEDIVQMLNFTPKIKNLIKKNKIDEKQVNCNLMVSKAYPINIRNKVALIDEDSHHLEIVESLLIYIENKLKMKGAILIFLPGWAWISELNEHLEKTINIAKKFSILPLHSTLSRAEQHKVFKSAPNGKRKIILSTNIAETSVTIDDVVFVIDYGKVKTVEFFDNITKLNTVWASKVNVEQRKGRAGRVQAGVCFNLYSKERFNKLNDNISPELINCSLSKIGLTIKLLKLGDINTFLKKAIDPPPEEAIKNVITVLKEIKCLNGNGELTALGNILAQLPLEPQLGRMMILGNILMLGDSLSTIAAGSSTKYDIFIGDYDDQHTMKNNFSANRCSDQLVFLNAFMQWNSSNDYCISNDNDILEEFGLSNSGLITTNNIKNQIIKIFMSFGFPKSCFEMQDFDFGKTGVVEPQLDLIPALLTMAFYPNIYSYKENRKVNIRSKDFAVVSRHSVNSPKFKNQKLADKFQSPFFVFEEQVNVMCMHSTMVTPIHLLLFGARKVEYMDSLVVLDDWIYLRMDVKVAAAIVALRPAIDDLIVRTAENPKLISKLNETDIRLISILTNLCNYNAGRHNLYPIKFD